MPFSHRDDTSRGPDNHLPHELVTLKNYKHVVRLMDVSEFIPSISLLIAK